MALTKISTDGISDDAVTTDKLANAINTARDANTAKTTNATHSGEVTGATALTIADNVVDEANLKVSNSPTNGYFLSAQSGNTGGLTWAAVNTDLSNDSSPQLGGALVTNGNNITFGDSGSGSDDRLTFGAGEDLQIYHDGSHSRIVDEGTGRLSIQSNDFRIENVASSELMAKFVEDGAVELYYDNSKKLETTSEGVTLRGTVHRVETLLRPYASVDVDLGTNGDRWRNIYVYNDIDIKDDGKLLLGDSDDLQIYHTSNANYINAQNGNLNIQRGGTTSLAFDGNGDLNLPDNRILGFGNGADLQIWHNGSTGNTNIKQSTGDIYFYTGSDLNMHLKDGTSVDLYYANSKKLETTADGVILNGASDISHSNADNLQVGTGSGENGITIYSGTTNNGSIYFADGSSASAPYRGFMEYNHNNDCLYFGSAGGTAAYFNNSRNFVPNTNNNNDLGSSSLRWRNIYTSDLNMSNEGSSNDVDGTWGSFTIQEGAEDLFLINKRNGKKYKFNLTEVS